MPPLKSRSYQSFPKLGHHVAIPNLIALILIPRQGLKMKKSELEASNFRLIVLKSFETSKLLKMKFQFWRKKSFFKTSRVTIFWDNSSPEISNEKLAKFKLRTNLSLRRYKKKVTDLFFSTQFNKVSENSVGTDFLSLSL